ncbi:MAG: hypothetical protein IT428_29040 [Planctomycetaceae bacterium]|nr:hypothetical protein [Planctomycetaceae bacterium]
MMTALPVAGVEFPHRPFGRRIAFARCFAAALIALLSAGATNESRAEVVRFEITRREPFAEGKNYGDAGPYERIIGRVHYAIDPDLPQNRAIVDLQLAPRNGDGKVEFSGDLFILAPADLKKGNGAILYDVNNRGNKLALGMFNYGGGADPKTEKDAGDGFLMRHGFTIVWSGWDGELLPDPQRLRMQCPVARKDGEPIVGMVRCELLAADKGPRSLVVPWAGHGSYRPTKNGLETATLTMRERHGDTREIIPPVQWKLHVQTPMSEGPDPGLSQLPKVEIEVAAGLKPGFLYELIYEAQDPLVHGVCFAGVRDLITSFRHGGGEGNPLLVEGKSVLKRAHGFGVSQSGRFLREFLYSGFNQDEAGRKVFDGLIPHVSGSGLGSFNHRFAQPTRHAGQHDHDDSLADRFPFTYGPSTDPLTGTTDSLLAKAIATKTVPYILHTQSAAEYWTRSGSLSHTDPLAKTDAEIPDNVRIYLFGGTQHGPSGYPPTRSVGQNLDNPGDYKPFLRGLLLALDRWASGGEPAPKSVYPTIAAGTLVTWQNRDAVQFPLIPGIRFPKVIRQPPMLDLGPRWATERIIDETPPKIAGRYPVLVPKCGADGNEVDCLSPAEVAVPVATYTGWNLRAEGQGAVDELVSLKGSMIPFAVTKADREKSGDPRPSLEERYGRIDSYLTKLDAECRRLHKAGYLTNEDATRILAVQKDRVKPLFEKLAPEFIGK